jgi:hypothetical protein
LSGCAGKTDPPSDAPTGVAATPGDGVILMSWNELPDLTYWIFYSQGGSVSIGQSGTITIRNASSPRAVIGLANDLPYSLLMNATQNGSPAGPNSPTVTATPRLAGNIWTQGSVQGNQNLNALAFNGLGRYVTVGDGTTIFAGDFNYGHSNPVGVTVWSPPTTPPISPIGLPPFVDDLKAVIFNGGFVALGSNGFVATSPDGVNWAVPQSRVQNAGVTGLNGLAFGFVNGNATYIAVGNNGQIYTTADLNQQWTVVTSANTSNDLTSIAVLNGSFVITGSNGTLLVSPDGQIWTQQQVAGLPPGATLRSITFMPNALPTGVAYVAVGDGGTIVTATQILRDANNIPSGDWAATVLPGAQNLKSVAVGGATGTRFLAVGQGGAVVFADSVINGAPVVPIQWSPALNPQSDDLSAVHFFLGQYLAVGPAGGNAVSH